MYYIYIYIMDNKNSINNNKNSIELFFYEDVIKLYLEDNKLYIIFLGNGLNDKIYLKLLEKLELFYEVCKKKNKQFYFLLNFSQYKTIYFPSLFSYISKTSIFLNKHKEFYKTHKFGTIFITETKIAKQISELILSNYTPVRPFKFINNKEDIIFDFTFD